jgi:hypothetical protein
MSKFLSRRRGQNLVGYGLLGCTLVFIILFVPLWSGFLALLGWSAWNYWVAPTFHLGEIAYLPVFVFFFVISILGIAPSLRRSIKRDRWPFRRD